MAEDEQTDDASGPDDAEVEQWLEEWAEVDRSAADYLDEAMRAIGREPVPGPDLDRMAEALRAGANSGAADYRYFVTALGGVDALPRSDRELWVASAASTMSPPEDPGDDVESQAVIFALQHADWLGLVLGLVRRGVGATPDAVDVLDDIDALEGVDGEIEDPDGLVWVLEEAIEVLAPRWEVLGILDDDRRLTRLGRWGLPVALHESWREVREPVDEDLVAAAMEILSDEPRGIDELRIALAENRRIVEGDELYRTIIASEGLWELPDGAFAYLPTLLEGLVLTHELTSAEIELEALDDGADLAMFGYLAEEGMPLLGGGHVVVRHAEHGYDVPGPGSASLAGPPGWLPGFQAGDVVALRYSRGEVTLEPAVFPSDLDEDEKYAKALVGIVRTAMTLAEGDAAGDHPEGVWFADLVASLRSDHPKILERAHPPLGQLLAGVGLEVSGSFFGLPGTPWRGEPTWFDDYQRQTWRVWLDALLAADKERLPGPDALAELAGSLAEADLVDYVQADLEDTPQHAQLVAAISAAVDGELCAVPLLFEARLAELRGDAAQMLALVEQAVATDPTNRSALAELGDLRSVAGDAADADRLYRLAGLDPVADEVVLVRRYLAPPAGGPARNKPCPCGSGKKYKLCHGRQVKHPLAERAPWLWRKIQMFVQRGPNMPELLSWAGLLAGSDPQTPEAVTAAQYNPVTQDFATFDGQLLERFLAAWGQFLPPDERELAEQWQSSPRRLLEVEEVRPFRGVQVRDLVTGETLAILDRTMSRSTEVKDLLLGRPLADGDGGLRLQTDPLRLPRLMRSRLLELMRDDPRGEEIAAFLAPKGPPEVVTPQGHELVDSTARYTLSDPDLAWSELAARYDEHGPNGLVVLGPGSSIRGHLIREGDRLVLHAMSAERLRSLQEVVAEIDPAATLIDVSSQPFGAFPVSDNVDPTAPELSADDYAQIARAFEESWLDQEIPALGGLTPRAAADDARADLVSLLDDLEWTQRQHPKPTDMDLDRVRRELGLA